MSKENPAEQRGAQVRSIGDRRTRVRRDDVWTYHTSTSLRSNMSVPDRLWVVTLVDGRLGVESNMTPEATRTALRRLANELSDASAFDRQGA